MSKKTKTQSKKSTKKSAPAKVEAIVAEVATSAALAAPATPDARLPPPGTLLQKRDRHGAVRCECTVEEGGIRYGDQLYRSLSGAAMAAAKDLGLANKTQNGFAFWQITKPSRKSGDPLVTLNRAWERYLVHAQGLTKAAEKPEGLLPALDQHSKAMEALLGSVA
jgi:hypothetical protein